ncbi:hypothetical protein HGD80_01015 [Paulownia witches'-broom phytoplasma]|uniref:Uncharacterized protein n=1 Tax=Paulownia witches'-broom phytoplasma TaxID=39647 RepID=A0ABX8TPF2_9MOLU|nr:hypothetical protein [Paulownia witches'-broom phytoplasma]QYC31167.1 hypothetical protein HGD80_00910 [Paulownia witches'-broom phytoplasma]QYC31184.1 hypothetical protein HGD80_01015 [Paulownia witches'-broom phytoplasma]
MSDGMTEACNEIYFKSQNKLNKKIINKYRHPKGKWVNLYYPNKTVPNKKKTFKNKRIKVIKNYSER